MSAGDGQGQGGTFGVSHLSDMPITLSYGALLLGALVLLIVLRLVFGSITLSGGAR